MVKKFVDMFSRLELDRIPACDEWKDRLTDGRTDRHLATA